MIQTTGTAHAGVNGHAFLEVISTKRCTSLNVCQDQHVFISACRTTDYRVYFQLLCRYTISRVLLPRHRAPPVSVSGVLLRTTTSTVLLNPCPPGCHRSTEPMCALLSVSCSCQFSWRWFLVPLYSTTINYLHL